MLRYACIVWIAWSHQKVGHFKCECLQFYTLKYAFIRSRTLSYPIIHFLYAFIFFHTLSKCFYVASILLSCAFKHFHTLYNAFICSPMLSYTFICFHKLLNTFMRFIMLSYAFIRFIRFLWAFNLLLYCFYTPSYAFINFHTLSYTFIRFLFAFILLLYCFPTLSYAFICSLRL